MDGPAMSGPDGITSLDLLLFFAAVIIILWLLWWKA
jgi:hypothetical protein